MTSGTTNRYAPGLGLHLRRDLGLVRRVDWFNHRRLLEPVDPCRRPKPKPEPNIMLPSASSI